MDCTRNPIESVLTPELLHSYSSLISLSDLPLILANDEGVPLFEFVPLPDFCKTVCSCRGGNLCPECRSHLQGSTSANAEVFCCPHGLSLFVLPVRPHAGGTLWLIGGYAYQPENAYQRYMQNISLLADRADADPKLAAEKVSQLQVIQPEQFTAHTQLGAYIASDLTHKLAGAPLTAHSVEKDILERKIIEQTGRNHAMEIDPAFLFNMLNCVARIAFFERAEKTENLIYQLSDLLRFRAQTGNAVHTVQTEIDHIEKYLYIQKARFQARLSYTIDVPKHIRSNHILNSLLHPLVENALTHGIMLRKDGGEIRLRAFSRNDQLVFLVIDNGNGFPQKTLDALLAQDLLYDETSSLCQINRRIKQYYGEDYGLEIVRSDSSGSTVSITIPRTLSNSPEKR